MSAIINVRKAIFYLKKKVIGKQNQSDLVETLRKMSVTKTLK